MQREEQRPEGRNEASAAATPAATETMPQRQYVLSNHRGKDREPFVFNPQLNVMGDASDVVLPRFMARLQVRRDPRVRRDDHLF